MAADPVAAKEARDGALKMAQRTLETAPADYTLQTHLHNLIGLMQIETLTPYWNRSVVNPTLEISYRYPAGPRCRRRHRRALSWS